MNIILNILNKKQNLSYPLIFYKISKYFWNEKCLCEFLKCDSEKLYYIVVEKNYTKMFKHVSVIKLLAAACRIGKMNIVKYCFQNKASILAEYKFPYLPVKVTPLFLATDGGNLEIVKFLVENGYYGGKEDIFISTGLAKQINNKNIFNYFCKSGKLSKEELRYV